MALELGHEVPEGVKEALDIWVVCEPYVKAWQTLNLSRQYVGGGMAMMPMGLLYSEMVAYARDHGFAETITALDEFVTLVQAQDEEFIAWAAAQAKKK
jgi:hypothetical protein